jgi:hypothetical protein
MICTNCRQRPITLTTHEEAMIYASLRVHEHATFIPISTLHFPYSTFLCGICQQYEELESAAEAFTWYFSPRNQRKFALYHTMEPLLEVGMLFSEAMKCFGYEQGIQDLVDVGGPTDRVAEEKWRRRLAGHAERILCKRFGLLLNNGVSFDAALESVGMEVEGELEDLNFLILDDLAREDGRLERIMHKHFLPLLDEGMSIAEAEESALWDFSGWVIADVFRSEEESSKS